MYRIYVIELSKKVFTDVRRFREANPQYNGVNECLYVGMTSKTPQERFLQHKGLKLSKKKIDISSKIVKRYGLYLRSSLSAHLKPVRSKKAALALEAQVAAELRHKRYAVWSN